MERVTEDTIFDIGDISKSFTAAAVALLVDRQILSWNTTIKDLVPRNRMKHYENCNEIADYRSVTVEDALCHRSGMPRFGDFAFSMYKKLTGVLE